MTDYRYIAADLVTDVDKADVPLVDASFGPALNGGGTCTGSVPLSSVVRQADLEPGRTALYCYRDDQLVWGGIVWALQPQGQSMGVEAAGFESYLQQRYLWRRFGPFVRVDPLALVHNIWHYVQSQAGPGIGVVLGNESTGGKALVGTVAEPLVVNWWDNRRAAEVVDDLADAADGFDYRIEVTQNPNGTRTKLLRLGYPRLGSRRRDLAVVSGSQVRSTPSERVDGTFRANHVLTMGAGEGRLAKHSHHRADLAGYPKLDALVSWKSETNDTRLRRRGDAELMARQEVSSVPSLTIDVDHESLRLGAYNVGDDIYLDLDDGWTDYTGWARIMAWTLQPESDEITLTLARSDLFRYGAAPDIGEGE